jgi:transposase InsO family protein
LTSSHEAELNGCDRDAGRSVPVAWGAGTYPLGSGPEFIAEAVKSWIGAVGGQTAYIERRSPWENGYVESFNGRLRDELLDGESFTTLKEASHAVREYLAALDAARREEESGGGEPPHHRIDGAASKRMRRRRVALRCKCAD